MTRPLVVFLSLLYHASAWHVSLAACRSVALNIQEGEGFSAQCNDDEVMQGLYLQAGGCSRGCVNNIKSMRCCKIDSLADGLTFYRGTNGNLEIARSNQEYGCGTGYFMQGFSLNGASPVELQDLNQARCARLPDSFPTDSRNSYLYTWQLDVPWSSSSSTGWLQCPAGTYMTTLQGYRDYLLGTLSPRDVWRLTKVRCAYPHDRVCPFPTATANAQVELVPVPGIEAYESEGCRHQHCEAQQSCKAGYENTADPTPILTCTATVAGDWSGTVLHCTDINECARTGSEYPCDANYGTCQNIPASYTCGCQPGFSLQADSSCHDNNECARRCGANENPVRDNCNDCDSGSTTCSNEDGSYSCPCRAGYERRGNPSRCQGIDECTPNPCPGYASCVDEPGVSSWVCNCPEGYGHNDPQCANNNECARACDNEDPLVNNCHNCNYAAGRECLDSTGPNVGFSCVCRDGFRFNAVTSQCDNIDECAEGDPCPHSESTCHDTIGTYLCSPYINFVNYQGSAVSVLPELEPAIPHVLSLDFVDPDSLYKAGSLSFGEPAAPFAFPCPFTSADECEMAGGAGMNLALAFRYCLDQAQTTCYTARDDATFRFVSPLLTIDTLRFDEGTYPPSSAGFGTTLVSTSDFGGEEIFIDGDNFYTSGGGKMLVTFGPTAPYNKYVCDIQAVSTQRLHCRLPQAGGSDLVFRVTVGSGTSAQFIDSVDKISYTAQVPEVVAIRGCPGPAEGQGTTDCPTAGGSTLTVSVKNTDEIGLNLLVRSRLCFIVPNSWNVTGASQADFQCTLPPGVGTNQPVYMTHKADRVFSPLYHLVSYAAPSVSSISAACVAGANPLTLTGCPRAGGISLSIEGEHFGASGASVAIGGILLQARHVHSFTHVTSAQGLHQHLIVTLPPMPVGTNLDRLSITVSQENGRQSREPASLAYGLCPAGTEEPLCEPCPRGTYEINGDCVQCPPGTIQERSQQSSCGPCPPRTFQALPGRWTCDACPPGTYGNVSRAVSCHDCPVGTSSPANSMQCSDCPQGKHAPEDGTPACLACLAGRYMDASGAADCRLCPAGSVSQRNGSVACAQCPRGHHQDELGQSSCKPCMAGRYSAAFGELQCLECVAGRSQPLEGQDSCSPCAVGTFSADSAGQDCQPCQNGSIAAQTGSVACSPCPSGRFGLDPAACVACEGGRFQEREGQTACDACPPGKRTSESEARQCVECSAGTYQPQSGTADCLLCEVGSFASAGGSTGCTGCEAGTAQASRGQTACPLCAAGSFAAATNTSVCAPCAEGTFSSKGGVTRCDQCGPGTYSRAGAVSCLPCFKGSYAALAGQSACGLCPRSAEAHADGTKCLCNVGSFAVTKVEAGYLQYSCQSCPPGAECNTVGITASTLRTRAGWWRAGNSSRFYRCTIPSICPGGQVDPATGYSPCAAHRQGPLCGVCEAGHKSSGGSNDCVACPASKQESWIWTAVIMTLMLLLLAGLYTAVMWVSNAQQKGLLLATNRQSAAELKAVVALLETTTNGTVEYEDETLDEEDFDDDIDHDDDATTKTEKRKRLRAKKALRTKASTSGVLLSHDPDTFRQPPSGLLASLSMLYVHDDDNDTVEIKQLMQTQSAVSRRAPNFMYKVKILVGFFQIATIISFQGEVSWPKYFSAFISIFNFFNFDFVPWQTLGCATDIDFYGKALIAGLLPIGIMLLLLVCMALPMYCADLREMDQQMRFEQRRAASTRLLVRLVLFTVFLLYPFVSRMVLAVYNCETIEGESFLLADFSLRCWDEAHMVYVGGMSAFILLYPIGIPLVYYVVLRKHRRLFRDPAVVLQFGFLFEAYSDDRWFWELVDMGHKLMLVSIVSFLPNFLEMVGHMIVLLAYTVSLLVLQPYIRKGDDRMHLLAQCELLLLAMVGWVLQNTEDGELTEFMDILVSALLILMTSGFLVSFLIIAGRNTLKLCKLHSKDKEKASLQNTIDRHRESNADLL